MLSSTGDPCARWLAAGACALAVLLAMAATSSLGAAAVKVDLGAIDTLPPAKGGSAGAPIELSPPAAIRAEIARRAAARRIAEERAAARRIVQERAAKARIVQERAAARRAEEARQRAEASRRRAEAGRKEAERRKTAADEKARKAAEARARAAAQAKDRRKAEPKVAAKSVNKSERLAPPAANQPPAGKPSVGKPVANKTRAGKPAPLTANRPTAPGKTRLVFAKGSTRLTAVARQYMAPIIQSLSSAAGSRLVIYAYASGEKARRVSLSRALAVRRHLIGAGIQGTRAEVRALGGKTTEKPLDRVDLVLVGR